MAGEAADVQLIDHGLRKRALQRDIVPPVIASRVRDDALHRGGGIVARLGGSDATVALRDRDGQAIGIQQDLLRIKPEASFRFQRPNRPEAVELARLEIGDEDVPVVVGAVLFRIQ